LKTIQQKMIITLSVLFLSSFYMYSQSNDQIDVLLDEPQARLDSTAYIVLSAGKIIEESTDVATAFAKAAEIGLFHSGEKAETPVRADEFSYMLMRSLSLKGGLMYMFFPGPRYAYREMVYRKVLSGTGGPSRIVSGDEVVRSLSAALDLKGVKE